MLNRCTSATLCVVFLSFHFSSIVVYGQQPNPPGPSGDSQDQVAATQSSYVGKLMNKREQEIEALLARDYNADMRNTRFSDVIGEIKRGHGVPIIIEESAVENNLNEETLITLHKKDVTVADGLQLMLRPYQCTFAVADDVLYVLSEDQAFKTSLETRLYDCKELSAKIPGDTTRNAEKLVNVIKATVEPTAWNGSGGRGTISEIGGKLVIAQSRSVHRQISKLLTTLDEEFSK